MTAMPIPRLIASPVLDPKNMVAEVAFIVQDEWQQNGMGAFLMRYLAEIAEKRRVKRFVATVLRDNKAMLTILENCGHRVSTDFDGETYSVTCYLDDNHGSDA